MRVRREHLQNLLAFLLAILVCLAVSEGLAVAGLVDFRLVFGTLGDEPWRNPLNRLDDELLHLHRPNQHLEGSYVGGEITRSHDIPRTIRYEYDIRYDARGFRNDRTRESAHTVVIGDSFIESMVVPQERTLTAELERLRGLPVVNLGQLWYGPQ
ncbi:MAG: hypothetical protein ACOC5E_02325, partial [Acidobacteriota bacterium]